ncbi:MAG: phospho-N-acetylmuramoyl-pentapeptide-transferase [Erysipelotrichaceae bacterium]|nr:phospho-N-acetylmuramoyl-pentapeptide-transferase [Erysipelotrichaceae bacterium]MBO7697682.1 phospho-N-acetylmuramoyl-pentapeptide-transferase [Erysipelotrichaceae bacterium]MBP5280361.1 phospho-N-acetylmuramoyl-pentapeptide-transferase [Erysipelotrichaceae bacterium]
MRYLLGLILSILAMILVMPKYIAFLKSKNISQVTSEYALQEFKDKEKTPIMGGLLFVLIPILVYTVIYFDGLFDRRLLFVLLSYVLYCSVGFIDDYLIISSHSNEGLSPITRLVMEFGYGLILYILFRDIIPSQVSIPFINVTINLRWYFFIPFMLLLYMAEANAVNFTDGMDGLCAGVSFIGLSAFFVLCMLSKNYSIALFLVCVLGGLLGYLKFNFKPAKIFMGDSGSLALGALFASLGIILDQTIALFFIGGIFVVEMLCVLIQQISVRLFHKRVFSYTPIHYAFVIKGIDEKRVVESFYLVELVLALIGLFIGFHNL